MSQKESEWEMDLASLLVKYGIAVKNEKLEKQLWKIFSKAKSQAVATREKEIEEEVKKKSFRGFSPYERFRLIKEEDIIKILNHK